MMYYSLNVSFQGQRVNTLFMTPTMEALEDDHSKS